MARFQKILNLYIVIVGSLTALSLAIAISYTESASQQLAGRYADVHRILIVVACMMVLACMVATAGMMFFRKPEALFIRTVAMATYIVGALLAMGLAEQVTPMSQANASALDWLMVTLLYLLGWAGMASAIMLFTLKSRPRVARSPLEVA